MKQSLTPNFQRVGKQRRSQYVGALLAAVLSWGASSCVSSDETTGSESHFVRCETDEDCASGGCEETYCEVNGQRVQEVQGTSDSQESATSRDPAPACLEVSRTPVPLSELGIVAADWELHGETAELGWNGSGWAGSLDVSPEMNTSEISVTVELPELNGTRVTRTNNPDTSGLDANCDDLLEVPVQYDLHTADGSFNQSGRLTHVLGDEPRALQFSVPFEDFGGTLAVTPVDPSATISVSFSFWWPGQEFSGAIGLGVNSVDGAVGQGSVQPNFATFSRTGCGVGKHLAAPEDKIGELTVAEELAVLEHPTVFRASWDDTGAETELTLTPTPIAATRCRDDRELLVDASMLLSTSDERIKDFRIDGSRRLGLDIYDPAALQERSWSGNGELSCTDTESWPFPELDCAELATVQADFSFNDYVANGQSDGGHMQLYLTPISGEDELGPGLTLLTALTP